ncbi:MAG: hypothetical protein GY775_19800 [Candidatus Scalindua sp.]|nr:hypothetical protein [Candidatus Scalindua sp.]
MTRVSKNRKKQIQHLVDIIGQAFDCNIKDPCRKEKYVAARAMAYVIIRKFMGLSYEQIGLVFNKHHATIMHGINEWPYMVKYNKHLQELYGEVYRSWAGVEGSKPFLTCEEKIVYLQEQINLLTLQLAEANNALEQSKLNQPETNEIIRGL